MSPVRAPGRALAPADSGATPIPSCLFRGPYGEEGDRDREPSHLGDGIAVSSGVRPATSDEVAVLRSCCSGTEAAESRRP